MMDVARQVRVDLGGLDPKDVKQALELAKVPISAEIARLKHALRRCGAIDEDDLRSVGQIAALEALKTWNESRGQTLRSWIGVTIRWRISEVVQDAGDSATREIAKGLANDVEDLAQPVEVIEAYETADAKAWVLKAMSRLTPRQQIVLSQRIAGSQETDKDFAQTFGVHKSQLCRDLEEAVEVLGRASRRRLRLLGGAACA